MTCHIFISGFVQGVGYRQFVKKEAVKLALRGWVKNLPDGRVETLVQGSKEQIEALVARCQQGPFLSEVKNVVVDWVEEKEKFEDFSIHHD